IDQITADAHPGLANRFQGPQVIGSRIGEEIKVLEQLPVIHTLSLCSAAGTPTPPASRDAVASVATSLRRSHARGYWTLGLRVSALGPIVGGDGRLTIPIHQGRPGLHAVRPCLPLI